MWLGHHKLENMHYHVYTQFYLGVSYACISQLGTASGWCGYFMPCLT